MDITLERMLSLIPKKADGKFVHGALKEFANTIGLKSGNLISDWMNGRSTSYKSYIYEVSAKYNVSVEWLKGETDQKEKPGTVSAELNGSTSEIMDLIADFSPEELSLLVSRIHKIRESR